MILTAELQEVGQRTRILRDRLLVKPLPYVHPTLVTPGVEIQKGVVIGAGYGRRQRRLVPFHHSLENTPPIVGPDGKIAKFAPTASGGRAVYVEEGEETGRIIPMDLKPGDVVEFSFRNITIVNFDRLPEFYNLSVGELIFVWRKAVYSIDPDESLNECLLWQQSAGYDRHGNFMSGAEDWHRA